MKFVFYLLLYNIFFYQTISYTRLCKTSILRAIGFHSRLTPNKKSSLCPRVALNCCSNHD